MTRGSTPDNSITDAFAWMTPLGYEVIEVDWDGRYVRFASQHVVVNAHYHWKDEHADITIARRWPVEEEQPYWSEVHLYELMPVRAPGVSWNDVPEDDRDLAEVFLTGSALLQDHAADLVAGENLELLDEIIASRPQMGVPGLDFPVDEPWAASREGFWMFTDSEMPKPMRIYLERSRSDDPVTRAVAALKMVVAARVDGRKDIEAGHARLHEMLADPHPDVRRAAGSALGEWTDRDALDAILGLLEAEIEQTPFAAAAVFIALDAPRADKDRVLAAIGRFAKRSPSADKQAAQLAWRLMGDRSTRVRQDWAGP